MNTAEKQIRVWNEAERNVAQAIATRQTKPEQGIHLKLEGNYLRIVVNTQGEGAEQIAAYAQREFSKCIANEAQ